MIKCKNCRRQTEKGEPTGTLRIMKRLENGGKDIISTKRVCAQCSGEKFK